MTSGQQTLRVLIRPELVEGEVWWVAQCLEFDIATQARTLHELDEALALSISGEVAMRLRRNQDPWQAIPKAPPEFWQVWDTARSIDSKPALPTSPQGPRML